MVCLHVSVFNLFVYRNTLRESKLDFKLASQPSTHFYLVLVPSESISVHYDAKWACLQSERFEYHRSSNAWVTSYRDFNRSTADEPYLTIVSFYRRIFHVKLFSIIQLSSSFIFSWERSFVTSHQTSNLEQIPITYRWAASSQPMSHFYLIKSMTLIFYVLICKWVRND